MVGTYHPPNVGLYKFFERWWGEPISADLVQRIRTAPTDHLTEFSYAYVDFADNMELMPRLAAGNLRPALRSQLPDGRYWELLGNSGYISAALNLLLYVHELVIDCPIPADPDRSEIVKASETLLTLKPLADAGILHFAFISSRARHPSIWRSDYYETAFSLGLLDQEGIEEEQVEPLIADVVTMLSLTSQYAGEIHPIARGSKESSVMTALLGKSVVDRRLYELVKLAQLSLPRLHGRIDEIVAIRRSSEDFHAWREALGRALAQVEAMSGHDDAWSSRAVEIVGAELLPIAERVKVKAERSPAITALKKGASGITIAGVGAVAGGLAGGNIASAAVSAGAVKAIEMATTYIKAVHSRRRDKTILDLALTFNPYER